MFSSFVFVCFIAKMILMSCCNADTSAGSSTLLQSQRTISSSEESPQLMALPKKIEELEKKQESLMKENGLLRVARQKTGSEQLVKQKRKRRSASDPGGMTPLPKHCTLPPAINASGAVYIRWGHHTCPSSSTLIYSGTAAGSSHHSTGNGANQLCLPKDPVYDNPVAGVGTFRAFLFTLEYQISDFPIRGDRLWHDVPCAVCKTPARFAHLMIPGKNTCPTDEWTLEYGGYLMAEKSGPTHRRSLFICVDGEMQTLHRTSGPVRDSSRALVNLVEARCSSGGGGIPCGPYIDGYELTCAVCTL